MRRYIFLIFCWMITSSYAPDPGTRPVFGVQVAFQANSQMITLLAFLHNGRTLINKKVLTKDDFVRFASGYWPSIYNPRREDLFELNQVKFCGMYKDSVTGKDIPYCFPLDSLWKLRWSDYPFMNGSERGWANETMKPSGQQARYLYDHYGVYNIDLNYFIDTSFWKILRDVQDPVWIENYKSLQ